MNYLTGIHRYATNLGIPGFVKNITTMELRKGLTRTVIEVMWLDEDAVVKHDFIPMESLLAGHYMITPFRPTNGLIEDIRAIDYDSISAATYDKLILHRNV